MSKNKHEKREHKRYRVLLPVLIHSSLGDEYATVVDISLSGIKFWSKRPNYNPQSSITIAFFETRVIENAGEDSKRKLQHHQCSSISARVITKLKSSEKNEQYSYSANFHGSIASEHCLREIIEDLEHDDQSRS